MYLVECDHGSFDELRNLNAEEMVQSLTKYSEEECIGLRNKCIHRDPDFQKFFRNRPYFRVKYHRKRSSSYQYIGPTISKY